MNIKLEYPNLYLKQFPNDSKNLFAIETCKVAVIGSKTNVKK